MGSVVFEGLGLWVEMKRWKLHHDLCLGIWKRERKLVGVVVKIGK